MNALDLELEDFTIGQLETCSYRYLQKITKSLNLPSNFKKVYLIEMIRAKRYSTPAVLERIITRVREERRANALVRKPRIRKKKDTGSQSTRERLSTSPVLTVTPKRRPSFIAKYRNKHPILRYHSRKLIPTSQSESDRVLRSCHTRIRPRVFNLDSSFVNALRENAPETSDTAELSSDTLNGYNVSRNSYTQTQNVYFGACRQREPQNAADICHVNMNGPAKRERLMSGISPLKLRRPHPYSPRLFYRRQDGTIGKINATIIKRSEQNTHKCVPRNVNQPIKRCVSVQDIINCNIEQRRENPPENVKTYIKSRVVVENLTENAMFQTETVVQESSDYGTESSERSYTEMRVYEPEVLLKTPETGCENNVGSGTPENALQSSLDVQCSMLNVRTKYSNMPGLSDVYPPNYTLADLTSNCQDEFSLYYNHKLDSVLTSRCNNGGYVNGERLPCISQVFSQFSNSQYKDFTQPLYVHVSQESEILPICQMWKQGVALEHLYNYKSHIISKEPVLQIAKTVNTTCVFSTPTIITALRVAQRPMERAMLGISLRDKVRNEVIRRRTKVTDIALKITYRQRNECIHKENICPRVREYFSLAENETARDISYDEGLSSMSSSQETNEMVEDALELISQDGDYMERIEMDLRMQCIICDWAGPKNILEDHILHEHSSLIMECSQSECVVNFPISVAWSTPASHKLIRMQDCLYVLTGFGLPPDSFVAVLSTLPTTLEGSPKYCTLTAHNKLSNEPFQWHGPVCQLSEHETGSNGLQLDITSLSLLPELPDLRCVDGALVSAATGRTVVSRAELSNICIGVNVQVHDWKSS